MFHVEPDCFKPRNNIAVKAYFLCYIYQCSFISIGILPVIKAEFIIGVLLSEV